MMTTKLSTPTLRLGSKYEYGRLLWDGVKLYGLGKGSLGSPSLHG